MSTPRTTWTTAGRAWTACRWTASPARPSQPTYGGLEPGAAITPEHLAPALAQLRPGVVLLLATGWSAHWDTGHYLAHPWLTPEAAQAIVDTGVRTVAVDGLSVDPTPQPSDPDADFSLPAHRVLCGAGGVIAENLTQLDAVLDAQAAGRHVEAMLFPLRLGGWRSRPSRSPPRLTARRALRPIPSRVGGRGQGFRWPSNAVWAAMPGEMRGGL
jgi:hypothetical protein